MDFKAEFDGDGEFNDEWRRDAAIFASCTRSDSSLNRRVRAGFQDDGSWFDDWSTNAHVWRNHAGTRRRDDRATVQPHDDARLSCFGDTNDPAGVSDALQRLRHDQGHENEYDVEG